MDSVLGTVQIVITGDTAQLQAALSRAEGLAASSGLKVSQGFAQGADGADKVVFAIGRLAGVIEQQSAAMSLAFQRNIATLAGMQGAVTRVGAAAHGSVSEIQAVGGAIRTGFGEQSIR